MNSIKLQDTIFTDRSLLHFYTLTKLSEREIKKIPFTTASKRIKYLGINLINVVKKKRPAPRKLYDSDERN